MTSIASLCRLSAYYQGVAKSYRAAERSVPCRDTALRAEMIARAEECEERAASLAEKAEELRLRRVPIVFKRLGD